MLDAWTDQGYKIWPEKGQATNEMAKVYKEEKQGTIAAEILQGMKKSEERCLSVSDDAILRIEQGGPVYSSLTEDISASDLVPQDERELNISELGLQRILQEKARQDGVKEKLASLEYVASIGLRAAVEPRGDSLIDPIQHPTAIEGQLINEMGNDRVRKM